MQYPIFHGGVGGNAEYLVPTVGGQPNRVLIQKFASDGKIVQVKADGASGANADAGAKIGDQSTPAGYTFGPMFGGSGTTFFPNGGGNMSPQIDSVVQPWVDLATAQESWGIEADVLSHFPVDTGATTIQSFDAWEMVTAPTGDDQTVTLSTEGPSRLPLSSFAGINKFKLAGYSETSFLVVTVDPADVVSGRVTLPSYSFAGKDSAEKEGINHILFDFSAITGEVEVVSPNEPVRGSIYAPSAHIVFPAESDGGKEFEGQIIAQNLTALQGGKEMHTNLFKGRFPCGNQPTGDEGTFHLRKILSGVDAAKFPAGTTFPVTATWAGGEETFDLPADGTVVPSGVTLPEGAVVTLTEGDLPDAPAGYSFVSKSLSADQVTILDGGNADIGWAVTNTYTENAAVVKEGTFHLRKILSGVDAAKFPAGTTFPVTATWAGGEETFDLPADGTVVPSGVTLPEGTVVTLTEGKLPDAPSGYSFVSKSLSADQVTILDGGNADIGWAVTNTYTEQQADHGGFDLAKILKGISASDFPRDTVFTVTASWTVDGSETVREYALPGDGTVVPGPRDLPAGTTVTFGEVKIPEVDGYTFAGVEFSPETFTIQAGETTQVAAVNTYKKGGLAITGGSAVTGAVLAGVLLMLAGGTVLLARRKRAAL